MRLSKIIGYSTFALMAVAVGLGMLQVHQASASTYGVAANTGYYDGQLYNTNNRRFMFMDGVPYGWTPTGTTADMFINGMHDYLYNQGPNSIVHQQEYSDVRASAIINMMMGVQTNDPRLGPISATRYQNGIDLAKQFFDQWAYIVRAYDRKDPLYGGSVDFNVVHTAAATDQNYSGIGDANTLNVGNPVLAPRGTAHGDLPDVVWAPLGQVEIRDTIIFTNSDGSTFMIKKWCGNITGDALPFPQDWRHQANIAPVGTTPAPGSLTGGATQTMNFNGSATNTGTMPSGGGALTAWVEINSGTRTNIALTPTNPAPFGALQPGASSPGVPFSYVIPGSATSGTKFCFFTEVTPLNSSGGSGISSKLCYTIAYSSYPIIQGTNGDIHAGGGICGLLPYSLGNIGGNVIAPSVGQYVVASNGLTQNFKSNDGIAPNNLLLGSSGGYASVCRPDLLAAFTAGKTSAMVDLGSTTSVDIGSITGIAGGPEVYYWNGPGALSIYGTIRSKVTIVATIGSIRISGNIKLDSALFPPRQAPSLGVIAAGDINIDAAVTRVDGFLFSNGTINTCPQQNSTCATKLLVNGFLMGKNVLFYRLGSPNTAGVQISEKVVLLPQLYLNPPKFFEASAESVLQSQGEKPPLY